MENLPLRATVMKDRRVTSVGPCRLDSLQRQEALHLEETSCCDFEAWLHWEVLSNHRYDCRGRYQTSSSASEVHFWHASWALLRIESCKSSSSDFAVPPCMSFRPPWASTYAAYACSLGTFESFRLCVQPPLAIGLSLEASCPPWSNSYQKALV